MNETKPKRPFNLTLFVLVTICGVAAGWVAYQLNWIRQRHEFLTRPIKPIPFDGLIDLAECPWSLKLFGEEARNTIFTKQSTEQEAKRLFPAGYVVVTGP